MREFTSAYYGTGTAFEVGVSALEHALEVARNRKVTLALPRHRLHFTWRPGRRLGESTGKLSREAGGSPAVLSFAYAQLPCLSHRCYTASNATATRASPFAVFIHPQLPRPSRNSGDLPVNSSPPHRHRSSSCERCTRCILPSAAASRTRFPSLILLFLFVLLCLQLDVSSGECPRNSQQADRGLLRPRSHAGRENWYALLPHSLQCEAVNLRQSCPRRNTRHSWPKSGSCRSTSRRNSSRRTSNKTSTRPSFI